MVGLILLFKPGIHHLGTVLAAPTGVLREGRIKEGIRKQAMS